MQVIQEAGQSPVIERLRSKGEWVFVFTPLSNRSSVDLPLPKFPISALKNGIIEGTVVIEFDWERTGTKEQKLVNQFDSGDTEYTETRWVYAPANPTVVFAEPKSVFEKSARKALNHVRYYFDAQRYYPPDNQPRLPDYDETRVNRLYRAEFSLNSKPELHLLPDYPDEAIHNEIEGNVVVQFDISNEGKVQNPTIVYSDATEILDAAAIDVVSQFTYESRNKAPKDVLHLVEFELNREFELLSSAELLDSDRRLLSEVPISDLLDSFVDIEFDIDEAGSVENAKILESNAPTIQQRLALQHTKYAKFRPKVVDGRPVRVSNLEHRYVFTPTEVNSAKKISELLALNGSIQEPLYFIHADANEQVIVEFDVDERGIVHDPKIVDLNPKEYYADLSLAMVKNFRYDPLIVDGKSVAVPKVRHSFLYYQNNKINGSCRIHMDDGKPRFSIDSNH